MKRQHVTSVVTLLITILAAATDCAAAAPTIRITQAADKLQITIDGKPFTTYHFAPSADDPEWHRPYFFPVISADGVDLTADRARETVNDRRREHPWHRSVWIGHGDMNGVDHWMHPVSGKKLQRHLKFTRIEGDTFVQELEWEGREAGKPVVREVRTVRIVAYEDGARGIDITTAFTAASGDVTFRVKPLRVSGVEAGWLAVRVPMEVSGNRGSVITSSAGAVGEADARTVPANWCDYSGTIGGRMFGAALFSHPSNPGHPSPFHVRAFGLLTRVGVHDWTLKQGESQAFRHMALFHAGTAASAKLDERYSEFAARP